jgi:hypothetical protein
LSPQLHCLTSNTTQMTIKITIKENSKLGQYFIKSMAEKKAWREAVASGKAVEYYQKNRSNFSFPVDYPESPLPH